MKATRDESAERREAELAFEQELLLGSVTDVLNAVRHSLGVSQKELAQRLGLTEGRMSQILSGSSGLTLSTLAAFGWATGLRFELVPKPIEDETQADLAWLTRLREVIADEGAREDTATQAKSGRVTQRRRSRRVLASNIRSQTKGDESMPRNERHVVPGSGGGWNVKAPKSDRSSGHFDRQSDAIDRAREIVGNSGGGEVVIHGRDGRVRDSDTIAPGNDPNPPRDRR
jgi:transcriptional regulator with XRE-family HTH domain